MAGGACRFGPFVVLLFHLIDHAQSLATKEALPDKIEVRAVRQLALEACTC